MTDKELIKLAAKAVGIKHPGGEHSRYDDGRIWDCEGLRWWNPLTDDADALRLAIKLGIQIIPGENYIEACKPSPRLRKTRFCEMYRAHDNPLAATRRAIVHAAAEIGMAMP